MLDISGRTNGTPEDRDQQLLQRRHLSRGRHPHELAPRRGPLRHLRPAGRRHRLLQGAREAAREPALGRGHRLPVRLARRDVARRPRAASARRAARTRANMTALVVGGLIAVIAVVLVALPFLRHPEDTDDRIDVPDRGGGAPAGADRGTRPCARGAQGARVRPPDGQGRRRRLPGPRRTAASCRCGRAPGPRCEHGEGLGPVPAEPHRGGRSPSSRWSRRPGRGSARDRRDARARRRHHRAEAVGRRADRRAQRPPRRAAQERGGSPRPDRRVHRPHPRARGERRRRLAPALDARAGPGPPSRAASRS